MSCENSTFYNNVIIFIELIKIGCVLIFPKFILDSNILKLLVSNPKAEFCITLNVRIYTYKN